MMLVEDVLALVGVIGGAPGRERHAPSEAPGAAPGAPCPRPARARRAPNPP
jgi:hypothetical protein